MSQPASVGPVRSNHQFDVDTLASYLKDHVEGFTKCVKVEQFLGGQSNPTFLLHGTQANYVLRKKPPGKLLRSAHQIEREYRIYLALAESDVPVPTMQHLCEDASVIGTPFYIMDYVEGEVFTDPVLQGLTAANRQNVYQSMTKILASLHTLDYRGRGLADFGKPGNYFARQTSRWTKQYLAAQTEDIAAMNQLINWLPDQMPDDDATSVVHGDYQLYNLLFDPQTFQCLAVLDWELSTLGHPLADLAYNCMKYHATQPGWSVVPGDGIPSEQEVVSEYCRLTARDGIANWSFYLAFSFFRLASIAQGVYQRGLQGNASSAKALELKHWVADAAETGWQIAQRDTP